MIEFKVDGYITIKLVCINNDTYYNLTKGDIYYTKIHESELYLDWNVFRKLHKKIFITKYDVVVNRMVSINSNDFNYIPSALFQEHSYHRERRLNNLLNGRPGF